MSIPSGNGLPPSPPNSIEGELLMEKIDNGPVYPPVPLYAHGGNGEAMDYMKVPSNNTVHQDPSTVSSI